MKLYRAGDVMCSLQFQVSLVRFIGRIKAAFANAFAVNHDLHKPFSLMPTNAKKPRFIRFGWLAYVLQITKTRYFSKIVKCVVLFVSVFVVNVFSRKTSGHVKPRKPMSKSFLIVDRNCPVPRIGCTPSSFTDKIWAAMMYFPNKLSGLWIVVKNGSNMVSGNHDIQFTIEVVK
jgi:hypothetical protein